MMWQNNTRIDIQKSSNQFYECTANNYWLAFVYSFKIKTLQISSSTISTACFIQITAIGKLQHVNAYIPRKPPAILISHEAEERR